MNESQSKPLFVSIATFIAIFVVVFLYSLGRNNSFNTLTPVNSASQSAQIATPSATIRAEKKPGSVITTAPTSQTTQAGQSAQPQPVIINNTTESSSQQSNQSSPQPTTQSSPSKSPGVINIDFLHKLDL